MKTAYALLAASLLLTGCTGNNNLLDQFDKSFGSTVTAPTRDGTAPTATLIITGLGSGTTTLSTGMQPQTFHLTGKTPSFFVMAVADDPQGIKSLSVFPTYSVTCKGPDGSTSDPPQVGMQEVTSPAMPGQKTQTRMWLPYYVDTDIFNRCPDGYTFEGGQLALGMNAVNYGGGVALSPEATFSIMP